MSYAIYLSPKSANKSALIFIKTNCHNKNGWIEKPNGENTTINIVKAVNHEHYQANN